MPINLLVVENEEPQMKIVRDAVALFNKEHEQKIVIDEAKNLQEALEKLSKNCYDGAIVDLRLEQNDTEGQGNEILKEIKEKLRFPVRVVSGHLGDLNAEFTESYLFKSYSRAEVEYEVIFDELTDIFSTGITGILNNRGLIEKHINSVFWRHISAVLEEFVKQKKLNPEWNVEKVLLRYISSHILEYLEISIDNNLEPVHNIEFYIKPPVKDKIFTGDVIRNKGDNSYWIVLTPACDLATDAKRVEPKAQYVTIVLIESFDSVTQGKNGGQVKALILNNGELKYHYLPKTILFDGGFINFQIINSIPINQLIPLFDVECVVTSAFRKDVISRFANYFSRQGQPSLA